MIYHNVVKEKKKKTIFLDLAISYIYLSDCRIRMFSSTIYSLTSLRFTNGHLDSSTTKV